jgi:hypothetical protein
LVMYVWYCYVALAKIGLLLILKCLNKLLITLL